MKFMKLRFENAELEKNYQLQILKQTKKDFLLNHLISMCVVFILLMDQIVKQNTMMTFLFLIQELGQGIILYFSFNQPQLFRYLEQYYYFVDIQLGIQQFLYFQFDFLQLEADDFQILQDMILYNYVGGSLTFIFFISLRFYMQVGYGFSLASIAYLMSGLFFIIDLYKQEKFRRRLFLKSQRNKQLELLIEEFIDDQISIIEKDVEKVRFNTIIFNRKCCEKGQQFIQFLKEVRLPQQKEQLLNYLYRSTQQKETLLGNHQNKNYQITYQSFTLKKQQMFVKIKQFDDQIDNLVNYKELYIRLFKGLQLRRNQLYKGKQIIKGLYIKSFYNQFTRYFQYYKLDLEQISDQFLKHAFTYNNIKWIANSQINPFYSDKKLILLLVKIIKLIHSNKIMNLHMDDNLIIIEFYVVQDISQYYINQINKILYHIGNQQISQQIPILNKIELILIDKNGLEKYYQ